MQSPVEKMIEAVEKSLILQGELTIGQETRQQQVLCQWKEIKSKLLHYERKYLEEQNLSQSDQYKELEKENSRLKWLLNVVIDQNLKGGNFNHDD